MGIKLGDILNNIGYLGPGLTEAIQYNKQQEAIKEQNRRTKVEEERMQELLGLQKEQVGLQKRETRIREAEKFEKTEERFRAINYNISKSHAYEFVAANGDPQKEEEINNRAVKAINENGTYFAEYMKNTFPEYPQMAIYQMIHSFPIDGMAIYSGYIEAIRENKEDRFDKKLKDYIPLGLTFPGMSEDAQKASGRTVSKEEGEIKFIGAQTEESKIRGQVAIGGLDLEKRRVEIQESIAGLLDPNATPERRNRTLMSLQREQAEINEIKQRTEDNRLRAKLEEITTQLNIASKGIDPNNPDRSQLTKFAETANKLNNLLYESQLLENESKSATTGLQTAQTYNILRTPSLTAEEKKKEKEKEQLENYYKFIELQEKLGQLTSSVPYQSGAETKIYNVPSELAETITKNPNIKDPETLMNIFTKNKEQEKLMNEMFQNSMKILQSKIEKEEKQRLKQTEEEKLSRTGTYPWLGKWGM